MKNLIYVITGFVVTLMVFSGCSSKTIIIDKPVSQLTTDKSKAYVALSYNPPNLLGPVPEAIVYEYNLKTNNQKQLITFDREGTYFVGMEPGKHYFIIRRVMPALALEEDVKYQFTINAIPGKTTYVDLQNLQVVTDQRKTLETKLKETPCNLTNMSKYDFKKIEQEKKSNSGSQWVKQPATSSENIILKYRSDLLVSELDCQNNKVIKLTNYPLFFSKISTIDNLKALPLIKPSKDNDSSKLMKIDDIKLKHNIYHVTHKNAIQKYPFEIFQYSDDSSLNQYTDIEFDIKYLSKIEEDDKESIESIIKDTFSSTDSSKKLKLIFTIDNYVPGNRAGRYFALSIDNAIESMASIQISVDFVDVNTGKVVGKVKSTKVLGMGIFGGSGTGIVEDSIDDIYKYTKSIYLKSNM